MAANSTSTHVLDVAVAYIRMSRDRQEASPHQQRSHILRLAAARGITIIRWYQDLGISGDDIMRRTDFRRMVADATTRHDFNLILCWSQDRFGRFDSIDAGEWVAPLRRSGIRLITVAEGDIDWTDSAGRLVYSIQQEGKNTFLLDLARNATRGRAQSASHVGFNGGRPPYGFDRHVYDDRGRFQRRVPRMERFRRPSDWRTTLVFSRDKSAIATIKSIFRSYYRGQTIDAITWRLNQRGIPSPSGGSWWRHTVRCILKNPAYVGDQVWNRTHSGKYFGIVDGGVASTSDGAHRWSANKRTWYANPKEDWIVVKDAHPAFITRDMFEHVQQRLCQREGRNYQQPGLPLTGLVRCGHCGRAMVTQRYDKIRNSVKVVYRVLTCIGYRAQGPTVCQSRRITEPPLLGFVIKTLVNQVLGDSFESELERRLTVAATESRVPLSRLKSLRVHVARLESQINQGLDNLLLADSRTAKQAASRLAKWQAHRDQLLRDISESDSMSPQNIQAAVTAAMRDVRNLRLGLASDERGLLHHSLQQAVASITLWWEANPKKPGKSQFARGVMVVRRPSGNGIVVEDKIEFTAAEVERCAPRKHQKRLDTTKVERGHMTERCGFKDEPRRCQAQHVALSLPASLI